MSLPSRISLEGRVAIVTGSSRGIGRTIAKELSLRGAAVVVNYHKSAAAADEVGFAARFDLDFAQTDGRIPHALWPAHLSPRKRSQGCLYQTAAPSSQKRAIEFCSHPLPGHFPGWLAETNPMYGSYLLW